MATETEVLMEASKFLDAHKLVVCAEPAPVFKLVLHARDHVNALLEIELRREDRADTECDYGLNEILTADERGDDDKESTEERYR